MHINFFVKITSKVRRKDYNKTLDFPVKILQNITYTVSFPENGLLFCLLHHLGVRIVQLVEGTGPE